VYDSYIHVETLASGCCDSHDGVLIEGGSTNDTVQGNVIGYNESNVEVFATGITVTGNYLFNPRGPFPRGQNFQSGSSSNLTISNNFAYSCEINGVPAHSGATAALACPSSPPFLYPANQEDSINFYKTNTYTASGNWVEGGDSPSGCGLITDDSSTSGNFLNNVLYDVGHCGIGIAQGTNTISGNKILNLVGVDNAQQGIYTWDAYNNGKCGVQTLSNNYSTGVKPPGTPCDPANQTCLLAGYWNGGGCMVNSSGNFFDNGTYAANTAAAFRALNPIAATNPPPLIPPLPKNCVAVSPYTTQTSMARCY
jgi:hypothetical protein